MCEQIAITKRLVILAKESTCFRDFLDLFLDLFPRFLLVFSKTKILFRRMKRLLRTGLRYGIRQQKRSHVYDSAGAYLEPPHVTPFAFPLFIMYNIPFIVFGTMIR